MEHHPTDKTALMQHDDKMTSPPTEDMMQCDVSNAPSITLLVRAVTETASTTSSSGAAASSSTVSYSSENGGDETEQDEDDDEEDEDNESESKTAEDEKCGFVIPQRFTKSGRKRAVSFALKLMKVLSIAEFEPVISWISNGQAFVVHNPKVFAAKIMPKYFKTAKYSSFTRKLHRWGFTRQYRLSGGSNTSTSTDEAGAFYHPKFQRDRLDMAETMACCKQRSNTKAARARKAAAAAAAAAASATGVSASRTQNTPSTLSGLNPPLTSSAALRQRLGQQSSPQDLSRLALERSLQQQSSSALASDQNMADALELAAAQRLLDRIDAAAALQQQHYRQQQQLQLQLLSMQMNSPTTTTLFESGITSAYQHPLMRHRGLLNSPLQLAAASRLLYEGGSKLTDPQSALLPSTAPQQTYYGAVRNMVSGPRANILGSHMA